MRRIAAFFITAALLAAVCQAALNPPGSTYYVAPDGDDANPGTESQPWRTIQKAADTLVAGDTVLIKSGTYTETVRPANSGTADAYITYKAYPGHNPVVLSDWWSTFRIDGKNYIEVNGLTLTGSHFSGTGIAPKDSHHIRIINNVVYGNGEGGIDTNERTDYLLIEGNVVFDNAFSSPYQGSGISLWKQKSWDQAPGFHSIVRRNIIYGNRNGVGEHSDGNGIIVDLSLDSPAVLIENNVIFGNGGQCIDVYSSNNVVVRNNTCYYNYADPQIRRVFGEITAGEAVNVRVFNNAIYSRKGVPTTASYGSYGLFFDYNLSYNGPVKEGGAHDIVAEPGFINPTVDPASADFHLKSDSPLIDKGRFLTRVVGSGRGRQVKVEDAGYFFDGFGIVEGDQVVVGSNAPVRIVEVDYENNIITLEREISWHDRDGVSSPYFGSAPDIGAYEYTGAVVPTPPPTPTQPASPLPTPTTLLSGSTPYRLRLLRVLKCYELWLRE
jgi:parallel beta-helix repeat protein